MKQARSAFGRIAAQTAKQVLLQRVRDAERDIIFNEYKDRQGQLIRGIVRRFEKGHNLIVDLGKTEGILPAREQTPRETYRPGDRIVAYVKNIDREARGPMIILSRQSPHLVEKLFEAEVPEIYESIVKIVGVAREPGSRSKIAVTSRDADVDPVGACVGIKGSRVQAVVQELRGEKIDIVPYDKDVARYIINAIQPAEVNRVIVDEADHRMELVVPDEKLSLAIGRKGQNVRLASQLTGWRLDIVSESKFRQMEDEAMTQLAEIDGMEDELAKNLFGLGFRALDEIAEAELAELASIEGVEDEKRAKELRVAAEGALERLRQERIRRAVEQGGALNDREALLLIPGMGTRMAQALEDSGYRSVRDIAREDPDRLSIKSGLGHKKARQVWQGAVDFQRTVAREVQEARERIEQQRADLEAQAQADVAAIAGHNADWVRRRRRGRRRVKRTCIGCRAISAPEDLVRIVAALEGGLVFDLARRTFGRGAWLHPDPACLAQAARGGIDRAFRQPFGLNPPALTALFRTAASRRALVLIGAARRAQKLEAGAAAVAEAIERRKVELLIVSTDASRRGGA